MLENSWGLEEVAAFFHPPKTTRGKSNRRDDRTFSHLHFDRCSLSYGAKLHAVKFTIHNNHK